MKKLIYIVAGICMVIISVLAISQFLPKVCAWYKGAIVEATLVKKEESEHGVTHILFSYNGKIDSTRVEDTVQSNVGDKLSFYYYHGNNDIFALKKDVLISAVLCIFFVLMLFASIYILNYTRVNWKKGIWKLQ